MCEKKIKISVDLCYKWTIIDAHRKVIERTKMEACSLYKRVINEGINFEHIGRARATAEDIRMFKFISGLNYDKIGKNIVEIKNCPCINISNVVSKHFQQTADGIDQKFKEHRDEYVPLGIANTVEVNQNDRPKHETAIPFDTFFLEIGAKTNLVNMTMQKDVYTQYGVYVNYLKHDVPEHNGIICLTVVLADIHGRPYATSLQAATYQKDKTIRLLPAVIDAFNRILNENEIKPHQVAASPYLMIAADTFIEAMTWLAAKNIKLTPNNWSNKDIKWSKKHFINPIEKHYTLTVVLPSKTSESKASGQNNREMPLHLVRGHLRRYTEERPLFGHLVGTYYIPSHARGNKEIGTITKDYQIKGQ